MAKTFKNLPAPAPIAPAKRASERDFFDLTDDSQPPTTPTEASAVGPAAIGSYPAELPGNMGTPGTAGLPSNPGPGRVTDASRDARKSTRGAKPINTGNTLHTGTMRNNGTPGNAVSSEDSAGTAAALSSGVRQTFVLNRDHLERLRDHVHARRAGGDYTYSQKQALQEALDLLFAGAAPVETRPDQVRAREQAHRERIQQGRLPRTQGQGGNPSGSGEEMRAIGAKATRRVTENARRWGPGGGLAGEAGLAHRKGARLSARDMFSPANLSQLQTDFADAMQPFELERGIKGSRAHHKTMQQMYALGGEAAAEVAAPVASQPFALPLPPMLTGREEWRQQQQAAHDHREGAMNEQLHRVGAVAAAAAGAAAQSERSRAWATHYSRPTWRGNKPLKKKARRRPSGRATSPSCTKCCCKPHMATCRLNCSSGAKPWRRPNWKACARRGRW